MVVIFTGKGQGSMCLGRREAAVAGWTRVNSGMQFVNSCVLCLEPVSPRFPYSEFVFFKGVSSCKRFPQRGFNTKQKHILACLSARSSLYMSKLAFWFIDQGLEWLAWVSHPESHHPWWNDKNQIPERAELKTRPWTCGDPRGHQHCDARLETENSPISFSPPPYTSLYIFAVW